MRGSWKAEESLKAVKSQMSVVQSYLFSDLHAHCPGHGNLQQEQACCKSPWGWKNVKGLEFFMNHGSHIIFLHKFLYFIFLKNILKCHYYSGIMICAKQLRLKWKLCPSS